MNSASSGKRLPTERGKRSSGSSTVFGVCLRGKQAKGIIQNQNSSFQRHETPVGLKVVSVSDEAFALLLIDNYLEKWRTRADEEDTARIGSVGDGTAAITTEGENTRRKQTKTAGKYT